MRKKMEDHAGAELDRKIAGEEEDRSPLGATRRVVRFLEEDRDDHFHCRAEGHVVGSYGEDAAEAED